MSVITKKHIIQMDETACRTAATMENLTMQLKILNDEIKSQEKSKLEFDKILKRLETRRDDLTKNIKKNNDWISSYDTEVGPFAAKYNQMTADIGILYDNAKVGHKFGIDLLKKEFGYHPLFKRPTDTFTSTPFKPK